MTGHYGAIRGIAAPDVAVPDADMAWLLAVAADASLTGHERMLTFVELGCGEHHLAINRILDAVQAKQQALPPAIFDRLGHWLDGYLGSPDEPQLRAKIADLLARQRQSVPQQGRPAFVRHASVA